MLRMSNTLRQHGFTGTEIASIVYKGVFAQTGQYHGFVVEVSGRSIASGFNSEAKARAWAKRKGVQTA